MAAPTREISDATPRPRLIGLRASVSPARALTTRIDTIEASRPIGHHGQREDQALGGVRSDDPDARERGDAQDDVGDEHDAERLEQVRGHAGAVTDVVADVVGDGGRVAGVVLGDARLDLADQVGADVGRLGEDATADAEEQRQERAAEAEADEDGRRGVLEDHHDQGRAQQAEARR